MWKNITEKSFEKLYDDCAFIGYSGDQYLGTGYGITFNIWQNCYGDYELLVWLEVDDDEDDVREFCEANGYSMDSYFDTAQACKAFGYRLYTSPEELTCDIRRYIGDDHGCCVDEQADELIAY